jgi:hypothetical protein
MNIRPASYEERIAYGVSHFITVAYTDTTSTTLIPLPVGTLVNNVYVHVATNWNSGTSATLSVGDTASATQFINAVNLLAAGSEEYLAAASTNKVVTVASPSQYLVVTLTVSGTAATAGALGIGVNIVDITKIPTS